MGAARSCCAKSDLNSAAARARAEASGQLALGSADKITTSTGKLQDRYTVGKLIGYGSFGEIRKVREKKTGKMLCVKIMTKRLMQRN